MQLFLGSLPAPLLYVSAGQINAVVPYGSPVGQTAELRLDTPSGELLSTYRGVAASPSIFSGAIINPDGSLNSSDHPAPQGAALVFYGTGSGQTKPAGVDGDVYTASDLPIAAGVVSATFERQNGQVLFAGDAPGLVAGVLQANLQMPPGLPAIAEVQFLVDGTQGAGPIPTTHVFVEQAGPLPAISIVYIDTNQMFLDSHQYAAASYSVTQGLILKGSVFDADAVVELYFNGLKIANLQIQPAPYSSSTILYTFVDFGGIPGSYEIDVLNKPNRRSARYPITVIPSTSPWIVDLLTPSPVIASIGVQSFLLNGKNFQPGVRVDVYYGAQLLASYGGSQLSNATTYSLTFTMDLLGRSGVYALVAVNPDGMSSPPFMFTAQAGDVTPQVTSMDPTNPVALHPQTVIVTGKNFLDGMSVDLFLGGVLFTHLSGGQVMVNSSTSVNLSFNFNAQAGSYGMELVNPGSQRSARLNFTMQAAGAGPTVTAISPSSPVAAYNVLQQLTITGTGFMPGATVDFFHDELPFTSLNSGPFAVVTTPTSLVANVAFQSIPGAYGLEVVNPGNLRSGRFNFTVQPGPPPPEIASLSPSYPSATNGFQDITVSGTGFQSGLTLSLVAPPYNPY